MDRYEIYPMRWAAEGMYEVRCYSPRAEFGYTTIRTYLTLPAAKAEVARRLAERKAA